MATASESVLAILVGFGAVHQHLCMILHQKPDLRFNGKQLRIVGVCDSSGGVYCAAGLDTCKLLDHKKSKNPISTYMQSDDLGEIVRFPNALEMAQSAPTYDALLEASPVDLKTGGAGLAAARAALTRPAPAHVIFANKAPLVLMYTELHELARQAKRDIRSSATVCGGLPVLNVAARDLYGATVRSVKGIFNSTTSYILDRMLAGEDQAQALADAQRRGIAEADPSLDIDGYDTANKLVLIANAMGLRARDNDVVRLQDVDIKGIRELTMQQMRDAQSKGLRIQLIASADPLSGGRYTFTVRPEAIPVDSFLGGFRGSDMGIVFETDIYETVYMKTDEEGVFPTAAAMLRDLNDICSGMETWR